MLHTANPVIKHKAGLLNLAEELSNVSKACKIMGVSRDTFYRYRELVAEGGVDAQINRSRRAPNLKNRTDEATEQAVVDYAVAFPTHGQHRAAVLGHVTLACRWFSANGLFPLSFPARIYFNPEGLFIFR